MGCPTLAQNLISSDTLGDPHIWAGSRTLRFPALTSAIASLRWTLRSVAPALPYSPVKLAKPLFPRGNPTLAAIEYDSPPPSPYPPPRICTLPPDRSSLRTKFITPAIASEPYWAAAPSRSTSACSRAMPEMSEMSGPWEPSASPLPYQVMTAVRWRRLPLTRTRV